MNKVSVPIQDQTNTFKHSSRGKRSFKEVMLGNMENKPNDPLTTVEVLPIPEIDTLLNRCWIGEVKDIDILRNIWFTFKEEGWGYRSIKYLFYANGFLLK